MISDTNDLPSSLNESSPWKNTDNLDNLMFLLVYPIYLQYLPPPSPYPFSPLLIEVWQGGEGDERNTLKQRGVKEVKAEREERMEGAAEEK